MALLTIKFPVSSSMTIRLPWLVMLPAAKISESAGERLLSDFTLMMEDRAVLSFHHEGAGAKNRHLVSRSRGVRGKPLSVELELSADAVGGHTPSRAGVDEHSGLLCGAVEGFELLIQGLNCTYL